MATPSWHISGQYYENCSCDFVCPCVPGQLAVKPTKGSPWPPLVVEPVLAPEVGCRTWDSTHNLCAGTG